ncbi:hypothetical protein [Microvirga puerhi]|uniref:Uncharacterized protein n=1 Tax=Microvirga puerhi TaxID=2876078 RepID=A0ABS7VH28_9HYPH|nr:hypothetical protein [Microvirga puerhi]MBZ6074808.1 hypothetical protein [Microvirga puerhi]
MMRRITLTAALGALLISAAGAMAQPYPAPVPNASGSQTTDPLTYGDTARPGFVPAPVEGLSVGTCVPSPNASGSLTTNPCGYNNAGTTPGNEPLATGSIIVQPAPMYETAPIYESVPVPNASGSQVTNPMTYGDTLPR